MAEAFTHLGFPDYFRVELSWAKLLGVVLLLAPVPARLKEWAYAGFAINLASALIAHLSVGDGPEAWGFAAGTGVLWGLSYFFWRRLQATPTSLGSHRHGGGDSVYEGLVTKEERRRMKKSASQKSASQKSKSPSQLIDARIKELGDWRGKMLSRLRAFIKEADPEVVEEWKWRGVPVWSHAGIICTGETYKNVVKMTFAKGASLEDPSGLFNSSLEGNTRRAIDFHEGDKIDEKALKALIRAAVALNTARK